MLLALKKARSVNSANFNCIQFQRQRKMKRFLKIFQNHKCNIIGMLHIDALPGTPKYKGNFTEIIEKSTHEANIYSKYDLDSILIENMHDIPYVQDKNLGPETIACMSRIAMEVRSLIPKNIPCGVQVLACGNKQALAIAKACNFQYIRAEGYVFGHIADEGYTDACAGDLLRYRKSIDADNILVLTDLKKKHSSHSVTADTSLLETAKAAEFFLSDGIILTGTATGNATNPDEVNQLFGRVNLPLLVGSGATVHNIENYFYNINGVIIGSHFKIDNKWENDLCEESIQKFMNHIRSLRSSREKNSAH